jgi:transposase
MDGDEEYRTQRLDHLGIVAGVCREIGLAAWLDEQAVGSQQAVSIGTATMAMVLNGLGFSNRQLYLVPQFFATKPVEALLGPGITAAMLNDDCLGRTLDWIYAHDPTRLFAGIGYRARQIFGISRSEVHVDTTSFSVSGAYESRDDEATIAVTYGYSRDHRADLKQWMLALATTQEGDVPLFLRSLDGNSADKRTLIEVVEALADQFVATEDEEEPIFVADSGLYSAENMARLGQRGIVWVARVPETSIEARSVIDLAADDWQHTADGRTHWYRRSMTLAQGTERWVVVRTQSGEDHAHTSVQRRVDRERGTWEKRLWHLGHRAFACEADAQTALVRETTTLPPWFAVEATTLQQAHYARRGRPRADAVATPTWSLQITLTVQPEHVEREWRRRACFIIGTNSPEHRSDEDLIRIYLNQGSVERGFRFLKDPLFLASSVFVKKPERIVALGFIMVLCLFVYRLAEHRLRTRLQDTGQTIPSQLGKPTARPTMRWVFQLFEGIDLLTIRRGDALPQHIIRLSPLQEQILYLLGPPTHHLYASTLLPPPPSKCNF